MSNKNHMPESILKICLTYQARCSASAKNIAGHFWTSPSLANPAPRFSPGSSHHCCWCSFAKISPSSFYIFALLCQPSYNWDTFVIWAGLQILILKHWGGNWKGAWKSFPSPTSLEPLLIFLLLDSRGSNQEGAMESFSWPKSLKSPSSALDLSPQISIKSGGNNGIKDSYINTICILSDGQILGSHTMYIVHGM